MGSKRFGGILFIAHPLDHHPPHVHAYVGSARLVFELTIDGRVILAKRSNTGRATRAEIRNALEIAAEHFVALVELWENAHA